MEIEFYLIPLLIIVVWVAAFRKAGQRGASDGKNQCWFFLVASLALVALTFFIFVYPELECQGMMCVMGPVLLWMLFSGIVMIGLPIWLLIKWSKLPGTKK